MDSPSMSPVDVIPPKNVAASCALLSQELRWTPSTRLHRPMQAEGLGQSLVEVLHRDPSRASEARPVATIWFLRPPFEIMI